METEDGRIEMFAELNQYFNEVSGGKALDSEGIYKVGQLYYEKADEIAGGHWINDKTLHHDVTNFVAGIFGTDGKMTFA